MPKRTMFKVGGTINMITSVVLRNPHGVDSTKNDDNPNDGLVTFSAAQIEKYFDEAKAL